VRSRSAAAGWEVGSGSPTTASRTSRGKRCAPRCAGPTPERIFQIKRALLAGFTIDEVAELTAIDPWFVAQLQELVEAERWYAGLEEVGAHELRRMKRLGFSDAQLARLRGETEEEVRERRWGLGVRPVYNTVDTCAGEFPAETPYLYSTYADENESERSDAEGRDPRQRPEPHRPGRRVRLLLRPGGARAARGRVGDDHGQLQPGDGLHRLRHLRQAVLRAADARGRARDRRPRAARRRDRAARRSDAAQAGLGPLERLGVPILGTSVESIDRAEDRERFEELARGLGVRQPPNGTATSVEQAAEIAERIGYPVLVRPSYVLGGRGMEIVYDEPGLRDYFERAVRVSRSGLC
jgi:carbamoyl-phosphate synthase large subunit